MPYLFIIIIVFIHASYEGKCLWLRGYCAYSTRVWRRKGSKEYSKKSNDNDDDDDHDDEDDYKSINYHDDDDCIYMLNIFIMA